MTSPFRSRHDADELQAVLDGVATPEAGGRHAELLATVALLTTHPAAAPRPEFAADLRERLLLAARAELVAAPAPATRTAPTPTRRRLGTLAASLAIVGGTAGMAVAAQGALPGDPLYPIKRGGEQVVAALQPGAADSGRSDLRHAATRLDEAAALQRNGADTALVVRAVEEFGTLGDRGARQLFAAYEAEGDPSDVTAVHDFAATQLPRLAELDTSDAAVQNVALEASDTLEALDRRALSLCPDCTDGLALPGSGTLAEAAGAPSIAALLARPADQAQLDADALGGLDRDQLRALGAAAEQQADRVPRLPSGEEWPQAVTSARGPVASTYSTGAGAGVGDVVGSVGGAVEGTVKGTVDSVTKGATKAVDDLVRGLGDGVKQTTDPVVGATGPLERPVRGLTDTADQALDGVAGVTGSLSQGGLLGD